MAQIETDDIDVQALQKVIWQYFYGGPLAGASARLAKIIKNHLAGEPLLSADEVLDEFLATEFGEDIKAGRGAYRRAENGVEGSDPDIIRRFKAYTTAKGFT